jgi:predicted nucleotidyltransferase
MKEALLAPRWPALLVHGSAPRFLSLSVHSRSSMFFQVVPDHVAVRAVMDLSRTRDVVLSELGDLAAKLSPPAASVIVFGSLARGEAGVESDIDVVVVRPAAVGEESEPWRHGVEAWRRAVRRLAGNTVEIVEVGEREVGRLLRSRRPLWRDVVREGVVVYGTPLVDLRAA